MAMYEYRGQTAAGREMTGTLEAESLQHAKDALGVMNVSVHSLQEVGSRTPVTRIGREEFLLFNQQLASITQANVPLEHALRQLVSDVRSRRVRSLIQAVAKELESGVSIEDAFARHGHGFPPMYERIVAAGVKTGRLAEMLTSLNHHLRFVSQTRQILTEALSYPLIVVALGAVLFTLIAIFVVPIFAEAVYDFTSGAMPGATRLLFWSSAHIGLIWIGVGAAILTVAIVRLILRQSVRGRRALERSILAVPLLGRVWRDSVLSRLTDAMALLVGAGCDLPSALRMGAAASGSEMARQECDRIAERIEGGQDLQSAGEHCWFLPALLTHSMHVASQRNNMSDALYGLSEMYAQHAHAAQTGLRAVLMPVMLIGAGFVLSFFIAALFMPIIHVVGTMS